MLVCWFGRESMQQECVSLVRGLWAQGISADILHESLEMDNIDDIQKFCREYKIPHIVILGDKALFFERKQVWLVSLNTAWGCRICSIFKGVCTQYIGSLCVCTHAVRVCVCVCLCVGEAAYSGE